MHSIHPCDTNNEDFIWMFWKCEDGRWIELSQDNGQWHAVVLAALYYLHCHARYDMCVI
jgi:hypothetical protein